MRLIRILLLLAIFVFGLLFLVQNSAALDTPLQLKFNLFIKDFIWTSDGVPFYFLLLAAFAVGSLLTIMFFIVERLRLGLALTERSRKIRTLEKDVAEAKAKQSKLEHQLETATKQAKELPGAPAAIDVPATPAE